MRESVKLELFVFLACSHSMVGESIALHAMSSKCYSVDLDI